MQHQLGNRISALVPLPSCASVLPHCHASPTLSPSTLQPGLLGIPAAAWTVGLVATFTSAICVVAADTGAYFVGKFQPLDLKQ